MVRLTDKTKVLLAERDRLAAATKEHDADCRCRQCEKLINIIDELGRREQAARRAVRYY